MFIRKWRTVWNSSAEEVDSVVNELRTRRDKQIAYQRERRVAHGMPVPMVLTVVTPAPAGLPTGVERHRQRKRITRVLKAISLRLRHRRVGFVPHQEEPQPFVQVGERPTLRWNAIIAERDADRRAARIRGTKNELGFNYSWDKVSDPCGYILTEIQRHMLEIYSDMGKTWFDPFWSKDEVLDWLETRVNQFLVQTGAYRKQVVVDATEEIELPNFNELRRVIYFDALGNSTPLEIADTHQKDMSSPGWGADTPGTPDTIIVWGKGITARLSPPPDGGTVLLDYVPRFTVRAGVFMRGTWWDGVKTGKVVNPDGTVTYVDNIWAGMTTPLPIPNIFYPYIKYGVMADMLMKEGESQDVKRAQYCESRFSEGVELAKMMLGRK